MLLHIKMQNPQLLCEIKGRKNAGAVVPPWKKPKKPVGETSDKNDVVVEAAAEPFKEVEARPV